MLVRCAAAAVLTFGTAFSGAAQARRISVIPQPVQLDVPLTVDVKVGRDWESLTTVAVDEPLPVG